MPQSDPQLGTGRGRRDRCPGVTRAWPADDGSLVRVRLIGGRIAPSALQALGQIATTYGDGDLHLTGRANVQLRGLPTDVPVAAFEAAGVLPSRRHDLARNVMVSPASGLLGGRGDLRPIATELDTLLLGSTTAAGLPGRFLFVLDDGRGDLLERPVDLGLVALDATRAQLRVGTEAWGAVVDLDGVAARLVALARAFLDLRGPGVDAAWHVEELAPLLHADLVRLAGGPIAPDPLLPAESAALPYGVSPAGDHVAAPGGVVSPALLARVLARHAGRPDDLVVTPWRGILVPA